MIVKRKNEQFPPLQENIQKTWSSCVDFAEYINKEDGLFLSGLGLLHVNNLFGGKLYKDVFYLFELNGNMYCCAKKQSDEGVFCFDGYYLLVSDFLKSNEYLSIINPMVELSSGKFVPFGAEIQVECRGHDYYKEDKLLFSNYQKVDLLYSHIIEKEGTQLKNVVVSEHPSLKEVIRWKKMIDNVNSKIKSLN